MIPIADDTIIIGTAELRKEMPKLTKDLKTKTIIVTKKGKPVAVLQDFDEYQEKNRTIDLFEDIVLGYIAKERFENSKPSDYISHEEMLKTFKIAK